MDEGLLASAVGGGIDCSDYARNATLGPLHVDYVYLHYCVFAGVPLLSAVALLLWLAALFFFRTHPHWIVSACVCVHLCAFLSLWTSVRESLAGS